MKKLLIALLILCLPTAALAAGKATITQETFYVTPFLDYFAGEIYCEITNTGDKPVKVESGVYEFYDPEGESIASGSIYSFYPRILLPGEVGFCAITEGIDEVASADQIADYSISIVGKSAKDEAVRLPAANPYKDVYGSYGNYQALFATVNNDKEEKLEDVYVAFGAYDENGSLLYCARANTYGIFLLPGSEVEFYTTIDGDILNILEASGKSIASVTATAYLD